nr:MAG TPA: Sigma-70, region 4 [Caudoviricetes sp.]
MSKPIYRGDAALVRDLRVCSIHAHNGDEIGLSDRQKVIVRVLRYRVTQRQRECLYYYYGRGLTMEQIARMMEVRASTVSRNIQNGVRRIRAALDLIDP